MEQEATMTISDWVMISAVLLAPVIAVQVQKMLEKMRESRGRKMRIFKTLMATRAAVLSADHVQALNMIDLEFHDNKYSEVTTSWKTYLDHLGSFPKEDEKAQAVWNDEKNDLLANLLMKMGSSLDFDFDVVHIKKGIYSPEAHSQTEDETILLRRGLLRLIYGEGSIKMDVQSFPVSEEDAKEQKELRKGIQELLDGSRELPVSVKDKD